MAQIEFGFKQKCTDCHENGRGYMVFWLNTDEDTGYDPEEGNGLTLNKKEYNTLEVAGTCTQCGWSFQEEELSKKNKTLLANIISLYETDKSEFLKACEDKRFKEFVEDKPYPKPTEKEIKEYDEHKQKMLVKFHTRRKELGMNYNPDFVTS